MPTLDDVRRLAMALPRVTERPCYGTLAFYVGRRLFVRFLDDDSIVIKMDVDQRAAMSLADPQAFQITDHYRNYPIVVVRLSAVGAGQLSDAIADAWSFETGESP